MQGGNALLASLAIAVLLAAPAAQATPRVAFMTSEIGTGNLSTWPHANGHSGIDAADAVCQAMALAGGFSADRAALFRAWVSTPTVDAYCHLLGFAGTKASACGGQVVGEPALGPWVRRDGTAWAARLAKLTGNDEIYNPVKFDQTGAVVDLATSQYWTGSWDTGEVIPSYNCSGWTTESAVASGTLGHGQAAGPATTLQDTLPCNESHRLLCIEAAAGDPTSFPHTPGMLAFTTEARGGGKLSQWPLAHGKTGLAAADEICKSAATTAGLPVPSSFVAWISASTSNASTRVTGAGPFRRLDGFVIANSRVAFLNGAIVTSVGQTERGDYLTYAAGTDVWTATSSDGSYLSPYSCNDWTAASNPDQGIRGEADYGWYNWSSVATPSFCENVFHLYCFSNVVTLFLDGF
ncbi:MAG: hypothetical protein U0610_24280, partial [bacterium]